MKFIVYFNMIGFTYAIDMQNVEIVKLFLQHTNVDINFRIVE